MSLDLAGTMQNMGNEEQGEQAVISVVIPAYKRPDLLRKAVASVLAQDFEKDRYEVIVVDSSPDEQNRAVVAELQKEAACRLLFFKKKPEGPGPSRNLGAQMARGLYIAFLDSDCVATPVWLRAGLGGFGEGVGLVQGRTLPEPDKEIGIFAYYVCVEKESFLYETCNMFYRSEAFDESGGFLSDLTPNTISPMGGEDVDLAWKVKRKGWKSCFVTEALVYHEVVSLPLWRWFVNKRLFIFPFLLGRYPELRKHFFLRYFFSKVHSLFSLALASTAAGMLHPAGFLLALPYVLFRASEPTRSLKGILRLFRVIVYIPQDMISFLILTAGSLRFRTILL